MAATDTINPDWDRYGDDWDDLSSKTLELDDYTCQRCFQDNGPLQAHHVEPRAQGGGRKLHQQPHNRLSALPRRSTPRQLRLRLSALTDVADDAELLPTTGDPIDVYVKRSPQTPLEKLTVTIPFWPCIARVLLVLLLIGCVAYLL